MMSSPSPYAGFRVVRFALGIALAAFVLTSQAALAIVIDDFSHGPIGTPTGRLDTSLDPSTIQAIARDSVTGLPETSVLGGTRFVMAIEYKPDTDQPSTAQIKQTDTGDGYVDFVVGAGGAGLVSYARPDLSPLADLFGNNRYDAFRFHFLAGTSPGSLTVSLRGDFPDGGNQLFARTTIQGEGWVDVPFSTLEGEFGGPPGRLGLPYEFLFNLRPGSGGPRDQTYNYRISHISVTPAIPEPSSCVLLLMSLIGTRVATIRRRSVGGVL